MTTFQLILLIASAVIFYMFFKQIFSESHPKRGIDFEAKMDDAQIGSISRPDKTFSKADVPQSRMEQLHKHADRAVEKEDYEEAKKALGSALILDDKHTETLYKLAYAEIQNKEFDSARENLEKLLELEDANDMAYAMLANVLHRLGEDVHALECHQQAIDLDDRYAPHYFNYANTLYDLDKRAEALKQYQAAYTLDDSLEKAKEMIEKLSESK